jgi:hypothetical protein
LRRAVRYGQEILNAPGTTPHRPPIDPASTLPALTCPPPLPARAPSLPAAGGFFTKLVPVVVENFSDAFPELRAKKDFVMAVIADEESSFNRTLDQVLRTCVLCYCFCLFHVSSGPAEGLCYYLSMHVCPE